MLLLLCLLLLISPPSHATLQYTDDVFYCLETPPSVEKPARGLYVHYKPINLHILSVKTMVFAHFLFKTSRANAIVATIKLDRGISGYSVSVHIPSTQPLTPLTPTPLRVEYDYPPEATTLTPERTQLREGMEQISWLLPQNPHTKEPCFLKITVEGHRAHVFVDATPNDTKDLLIDFLNIACIPPHTHTGKPRLTPILLEPSLPPQSKSQTYKFVC